MLTSNGVPFTAERIAAPNSPLNQAMSFELGMADPRAVKGSTYTRLGFRKTK
ncbi:hypothetical protein [[Roseibacterium] beibuensis]|uniref:hypothetical protein n=1 Tax=[Roseibacterium] beibuensis TaxID=1193142 RepID=UPI00217EDC46|nr:hypothetical protein [Roseibacterium beibuensis]